MEIARIAAAGNGCCVFSGIMQGVVGAYLSLLCEMCGARTARLLIRCPDAGRPLIVLDHRHTPAAPGGAGCARDAQIPLMFSTDTEHNDVPGPVYRPGTGRPHPDRLEGHVPDRDWFEAVIGEDAISRWRLAHRAGTDDWRFEGELCGLGIEVRLELPVPHSGQIHRRLHSALAILRLFESLLPDLDLLDRRVPPAADGALRPFDPPLIGPSAAMDELRRRIRAAADAAIPVLINGESGTGKEIVARNLHRLGGRRARPLVIVNCMELPETLLQTELFGHLRGAFTGASKDRMGLVESADGGTLFLDEIGEMPLTQQAALLRVLQEREVRRIGDSRRRTVDVRFIFATNRDLADLVERGRFREDLYYRVNGIRLLIPPLRRRKEDIPPLIEHFISRCGGAGPVSGISAEAMRDMLTYHWPGNVRELRNEIERIIALHRGAKRITVDMLSPRIRESTPVRDAAGEYSGETLKEALARLERRLIADALTRHNGNRTRTAASLGITRQGLLKKIRRHGIRRPGTAGK